MQLAEWACWWMWRKDIEGSNTRGWNEAEQLVRLLWCFFAVIEDSGTQSTRSVTRESIEAMVTL